MLQEYLNYLDKHFEKREVLNQTHYCFKSVPNSLKVLHIKMKKEKDIKWKPETLSIISYAKGLQESEINNKCEHVESVINNNNDDLFDVERPPKWFLEFSKVLTYLNVFRGTIVLSSDIINNALCVKPKCIKGQYYIGQYSGITNESCPIFTNEKGEIFVYNAAEFRNYPKSEREIKKYLKTKLKLIRKWPNINYFLVEETERFIKMFSQHPTIYAIKNSKPQK